MPLKKEKPKFHRAKVSKSLKTLNIVISDITVHKLSVDGTAFLHDFLTSKDGCQVDNGYLKRIRLDTSCVIKFNVEGV